MKILSAMFSNGIFWLTYLAFILLPQALCALYAIVENIKDWEGCGDSLPSLFFALLYPLWVPAESIYLAARELFWGEDKETRLTTMKGMKMFEHLGKDISFSVFHKCKFLIFRRGRPTADTDDHFHHKQRRTHWTPFFSNFRWDYYYHWDFSLHILFLL